MSGILERRVLSCGKAVMFLLAAYFAVVFKFIADLRGPQTLSSESMRCDYVLLYLYTHIQIHAHVHAHACSNIINCIAR